MVFQYSFMFFHGSWLDFLVFQSNFMGLRNFQKKRDFLVFQSNFMVFQVVSWFFKVVSWFLKIVPCVLCF